MLSIAWTPTKLPFAGETPQGSLLGHRRSELRKQDAARKIAERDGIDNGLVCVFSAVEPGRTYGLRCTTGQPWVQTAKLKC